MSWKSRVAWYQGVFLQPQHFQQESRSIERAIDAARNAVAPHAWGFAKLVLDDSALQLGRIAIGEASGVLPDGTPFAIPSQEPAPPPLEVGADFGNEEIFLTAPLARQGAVEFDFDGAGDREISRFRVETLDVRDQTSVGQNSTAIQIGRLNLRLIRAKEATDAYAAVALARVKERRPDMSVVLDREFIAPQFAIGATPHLPGAASLLQGLLRQRAEALAARMGQLGHGLSELADFLMLQTMNRYEPLLAQYVQLGRHHPQAFYETCLQLAGDLATLLSPKRRPSEYPAYRHNNLEATFAPVLADLRRMLSTVLEQNAIPIELTDRKHGVRTASVADQGLLRSAAFVLAINADMPSEQLHTNFLAQSKIGPVEKIRDLVNLQLPGIVARTLPVAPRQLPFHAGYSYFELERGTDLWKQFERSGNLAIHTPGDLPGLSMELWAIRQ